jgi:predicted transcriptional regulator of viral defense system
MTDRLLLVAGRRGGVLTSADARALDVGPDQLATLVRRGILVRVRRDAYVLGELWRPAPPEQRLALRTRAVLRARGDGVATHQSALALHGLPVVGAPLDVVDVTGPVSRVRLASGVRVHPPMVGVGEVDLDGCRALPVADAIAQVAVRHTREATVVAADAALQRRLTCRPELVAALERAADEPAVRRAARWLEMADASAESVGETRTRLLLRDLGYAVRSQVRVADDEGYVVGRVDLLVEGQVIVEFDGMVKYEGADGRAALAAEKRREDRLRALGFEVVRLTWAALDRPEVVDRLVRSALDRAARRGTSGRTRL